MPWLVVSLSHPPYERKSRLWTPAAEEQIPIVIEEVHRFNKYSLSAISRFTEIVGSS